MKEILSLKNIRKKYENGVEIQEISFEVLQGEIFSIVGESGSGKSTIAKLIVGLLEKTSGTIYYDNQDISEMSPKERKKLHQKIQMIFQSPYASLNPKCTVREIIAEGLIYQKVIPKERMEEYIRNLMEEVGLKKVLLESYPSQLSGGECQRVGIARALAVQPELIIADECLSALDMITQAQILKLFQTIIENRKLSCIFISHDLSVVKKISNRLMVMKEGRIVEQGKTEDVFRNPQAEYTKQLLKYQL